MEFGPDLIPQFLHFLSIEGELELVAESECRVEELNEVRGCTLGLHFLCYYMDPSRIYAALFLNDSDETFTLSEIIREKYSESLVRNKKKSIIVVL